METINKILRSKINIFLIMSFAGIFAFFLWLVASNNSAPADWLVMENNYKWQFADFFRHIVYSSDLKNVYMNHVDAVFPPLAYLFFHLLYRLNPRKYNIDLSSWTAAKNYQFNLLIFVIVEMITAVMLYLAIKKTLKINSEKKTFAFFIAILLSAPFAAGAIERGNPALITLTLILIALYLKDSTKTIDRHISLIVLAIAVGFKIYPGIFILLWLKEKRIKDIFWFALYCIIIDIVPFLFTGGIGSIMQYYHTVMEVSIVPPVERWTSIELYYYSVCKKLNISYSALAGNIIRGVFFAVGVILALLSKKKWKTILFLATIMAVFVPNAYRYVSIYLLIPLLYYLQEDEIKISFKDTFYLILFGLIFTIPTWAINIKLPVEFAIFTPIYVMYIIAIIGETYNTIIRLKKRRIWKKIFGKGIKKLEA